MIDKQELKLRIEEHRCIDCGEPFSDKNVFTALGWEETKLSGMCENCFDSLFKDEDEDGSE